MERFRSTFQLTVDSLLGKHLCTVLSLLYNLLGVLGIPGCFIEHTSVIVQILYFRAVEPIILF